MKKLFLFFPFLILTVALIFILYCNNLSLVKKEAVTYYKDLRKALKAKRYDPNLLVISTKRFSFHNKIQIKLSGAATKSRHLTGDAIDFLVLDVNNDGKRNAADVDIVYKILEEEIMKGKGGIGIYKNEKSFIDRQMIHIDCREIKGRWSK
jgi:uncharacterized protein YcbK (DUF882 family)